MCMDVLPAYMCGQHVCLVPVRARGFRPLKWVSDSCEMPRGAEN